MQSAAPPSFNPPSNYSSTPPPDTTLEWSYQVGSVADEQRSLGREQLTRDTDLHALNSSPISDFIYNLASDDIVPVIEELPLQPYQSSLSFMADVTTLCDGEPVCTFAVPPDTLSQRQESPLNDNPVAAQDLNEGIPFKQSTAAAGDGYVTQDPVGWEPLFNEMFSPPSNLSFNERVSYYAPLQSTFAMTLPKLNANTGVRDPVSLAGPKDMVPVITISPDGTETYTWKKQ